VIIGVDVITFPHFLQCTKNTESYGILKALSVVKEMLETKVKLCITQVDRWRHSVSDVVEYVTTEKFTRIYFQHTSCIHTPVKNSNTLRLYCNKFAVSISQWKFITLTVQYTTLDYSSQLFLKSNTRMTDSWITANTSTSSSFSTGSLIPIPDYNQ
jgi:hypothetical protein